MKVFIIAALTADGFIARHAGHATDWTSPEDKQLFVRLTKEAGTIVMGSRTFASLQTIGKTLPGRRKIIYTSKPHAVAPAADIQTTSEPPGQLVARLRQSGAAGLAICGGASIYRLFMEAGVVDELYLTVEPVLFGQGVTLFDQPLDTPLTLLDSQRLGSNTVLLHYAADRDAHHK